MRQREPAHPAPRRGLRARLRRRVRARGLAPGGRRRRRSTTWPRASTARSSRSRRAAGRSSTASASQLAFGERGDDRLREPEADRRPARGGDRRRSRRSASIPDKLYPLLADRSRGFVYLAAQGRSREGGGARGAGDRRARLLSGGAPRSTRSGRSRRRSSATRASTTAASPGSSSSSTTSSPGAKGVEDDRPRPVRADARRRRVRARSARQRRLPDHRPHAPGPGRAGPRRTRARWGAQSATAVVLDPRTGGILAIAVEPGFDANAFPTVAKSDEDRLRNRAVTDTYEPGSTFKVVTLGGVLEDEHRHADDEVHAAVQDPGRRPRHPRRASRAERRR